MTKINLRRAAALQVSIQDAIRALNVNPQVEISMFSEFGEVVPAQTQALMKNIQTRGLLIRALFQIRNATAKANMESGISAVLANQAEIDMEIACIQPLAESQVYEGKEITEKRAARMASQKETTPMYGRQEAPSETIKVMVGSKASIDNAKESLAALRKTRLDLKDRLGELNATVKIDLTEETVETLRSERIL